VRSAFQFLGRNSGRSDTESPLLSAGVILVSIPRSEFWSFGHEFRAVRPALLGLFQFLGRNSGRSDALGVILSLVAEMVSIPRSEFWSFGPYVLSKTHRQS